VQALCLKALSDEGLVVRDGGSALVVLPGTDLRVHAAADHGRPAGTGVCGAAAATVLVLLPEF